MHFFRIDNNHVIAHVLVGLKGRLVLAAEDLGNLAGQTADSLIRGIHQVPGALDGLAGEGHIDTDLTEKVDINVVNSPVC